MNLLKIPVLCLILVSFQIVPLISSPKPSDTLPTRTTLIKENSLIIEKPLEKIKLSQYYNKDIPLPLVFKDSFSKYKYCMSFLISNSMSPSIKTNDIVISDIEGELYNKWHKELKVRLNDIVTFYRDGLKICHRISQVPPTGTNTKKVVTKGDNNDFHDNPIHLNDINGKVVLIIENDLHLDHNKIYLSFSDNKFFIEDGKSALDLFNTDYLLSSTKQYPKRKPRKK